MHATLLITAMVVSFSLPPHPLNHVISGRNGNHKPRNAALVVRNVLDSRTFESMVRASVEAAADQRVFEDRELMHLTFGQRVRYFLGGSFGNIDFIEEWQPSMERGFGSTDGPQPITAIDEAIGDEARSAAAVLASLRKSRAFVDLLHRAAREGRPLPRGEAGPNYAESVRIEIAHSLQYVSDPGMGNLGSAAPE